MNISDSSPVFSVIIATYNRPHLLPRAINSVLKQSFADFELIIVDDLSPDHTQQVVASFADTRIKYIRRQVNGGCPAAKNTGIRAAVGKYIALLDDDDEYFPDFLNEMYQAWQQAPARIGVSWCGTQLVRDKDQMEEVVEEQIWQPIFKDREDAHLSFLRSRQVGGNCGLTFRRSTLMKIGLLDERLRKADDTDLLVRIVREYDFMVVAQILIKIHHHGSGRLTTYDQTMAEAYELILQKNIRTLLLQPSLYAALFYKTGWIHYHSGNKFRGRYFTLQALRKHPFHVKSWLALLVFEIAGQTGTSLHRNISRWRHQLRHYMNPKVYLNG